MGNQIAQTPVQILDIKLCLKDLNGYEFVQSLGITRFLKVAQAKVRNNLLVVKVFQIGDQAIPYDQYQKQNEEINYRIRGVEQSPSTSRHYLPYQINIINDRIFFIRPYIKDNLFYRLQTLPYLTGIEKKWIAFQILHCLKQIHQANVVHGDLKIENILLTSYNWVLLSDFADFKPTFFSHEGSAEYYYYFNASKRNACYLAPERFYDAERSENRVENETLSTSFGKIGKASMDIFSLGCIFCELFTEQPLFNLTQMMEYRVKTYDPKPIIDKIPDENFRAMITSMIDRNPAERRTAEQYLEEQIGKGFPTIFSTFIMPYVRDFVKKFSPDYVIFKLHRDFPSIMNAIFGTTNPTIDTSSEKSELLLIILSLALVSIRKLRHLNSKLVALELLRLIIPFVDESITLDRILPYIKIMLNDKFSRVRADAIRTLTFAISSVKKVNQENAYLFSVYLFPDWKDMPDAEDFLVRYVLATNLSSLAAHSSRFLKQTFFSDTENRLANNDYLRLYEDELREIQKWILERFSNLIHGAKNDNDGPIIEALCRSNLELLCGFFGKRKTIENICGHLITLLSQTNWRIRAAFFDSLVTVAAYIGIESEVFIEPLLKDGLFDEEFVVQRVLNALAIFVDLGLMKRGAMYDFLKIVAPLLCHPSPWLRLPVIHFINTICKKSHMADIHGFVLPMIQRFLKHRILQVENPEVLYNALIEPLPRDIFDHVRHNAHESFFDHLGERSRIRQITGNGLKPAYIESKIHHVHDMLNKLLELKMREEDEQKILELKPYLKPSAKVKSSINGSSSNSAKLGAIDIPMPPGKFRNLSSSNLQTIDNYTVRAPYQHPDWSELFGANQSSITPQSSSNQLPAVPSSESRSPKYEQEEAVSLVCIPQVPITSKTRSLHQELIRVDSKSRSEIQSILRLNSVDEFNALRLKQESIYREDCQRKDLIKKKVATSVFEIAEPKSWSPVGGLLGHIHVHNTKITRLVASHLMPGTYHSQYFATGDSNGGIRVWDINEFQRAPIFRPRHSARGPTSPIRGLAFSSDNPLHIAALTDNGHLNIYDCIPNNTDIGNSIYSLQFDPNDVGVGVNLKYFNTGSRGILALATSQGLICGIDTRSPALAFRLKNDLAHRLITALEIDELQSWLAVGTGSGYIDVWDLRFQLCIQMMSHPTGARVISLLRHQDRPNSLISSYQGNNEVAVWNIDEPLQRNQVFWPSSVEPLSMTRSLNHYVASMYLWKNDSSTSLLCSGTDMRIRNWNLTNPTRSYIVCRGPADDDTSTTGYLHKRIDGVDVTIEEYYTKKTMTDTSSNILSPSIATSPPKDMKGTKPSANIPPAHTDTVTGMQMIMSRERTPYLVTASNDGVVKLWK